MTNIIIKRRNGEETCERTDTITRKRNGVYYTFDEYYYLDYDINGIIEMELVKHYNRDQTQRSIENEKTSYLCAVRENRLKQLLDK